jgi:uncharacterized membrane protein YfcA
MDGATAGFTSHVFLGFLALGFAVGSFGTLIGAGGGFLLVPVLLLLYPEESPASVTAVSLTVVFFNAYAGTWAYARLGRINYPAGLLFAAAALPGALLGTLVVAVIPRDPFDVIFGILLLALGLYMVIQPIRGPRSAVPHPGAARTWERRSLLGSIGSAYLGVLSSVLGIGGGILYVPFLIRFLDFPPHAATATSQFVLALGSCTAMVAHLLQGSLDGQYARTACLALGVMLGAPIGALVSERLGGSLLVRLLALSLCAVAGRLLWRFAAG